MYACVFDTDVSELVVETQILVGVSCGVGVSKPVPVFGVCFVLHNHKKCIFLPKSQFQSPINKATWQAKV